MKAKANVIENLTTGSTSHKTKLVKIKIIYKLQDEANQFAMLHLETETLPL